MNKEKKIIKLHGMSSEKASRVKKRGHNKEHIFAGKVISHPIINSYKDSKTNSSS